MLQRCGAASRRFPEGQREERGKCTFDMALVRRTTEPSPMAFTVTCTSDPSWGPLESSRSQLSPSWLPRPPHSKPHSVRVESCHVICDSPGGGTHTPSSDSRRSPRVRCQTWHVLLYFCSSPAGTSRASDANSAGRLHACAAVPVVCRILAAAAATLKPECASTSSASSTCAQTPSLLPSPSGQSGPCPHRIRPCTSSTYFRNRSASGLGSFTPRPPIACTSAGADISTARTLSREALRSARHNGEGVPDANSVELLPLLYSTVELLWMQTRAAARVLPRGSSIRPHSPRRARRAEADRLRTTAISPTSVCWGLDPSQQRLPPKDDTAVPSIMHLLLGSRLPNGQSRSSASSRTSFSRICCRLRRLCGCWPKEMRPGAPLKWCFS